MKIAILDGNNLAFKIFSRFKESRSGLLKTSFGVPTTVIFGLLRTLNFLVTKTNFDRMIVCWDVSGSRYRKRLFPLYKKHRKVLDMKEYYEELDSARKYLEKFGISQGIAKGIEADDLIGFLANLYAKKKHKIIIVSDDKDYYQLVSKKIKIFRPIKDEFVTKFSVECDFGMKPKNLPRIKALSGEDSDFIPGVGDIDEKNIKIIKKGLGEKTAIKLLKGKKSLKDAIENCTIDRWKELLCVKEKQIFLSYKLARIRTKRKQYRKWEQVILNDAVVRAEEIKNPSIRTVLRIRDDLELSSINIIHVLKRLGVKFKGKDIEHGFHAIKIKT